MRIEKCLFQNRLGKRRIREFATLNDRYGYVAIIDGKVVGYILCAVPAPWAVLINELAVHRNAQQRGIGKALMRVVLDQEQQRQTLYLNVFNNNHKAQRLYESLGFKVSLRLQEHCQMELAHESQRL